MNNTAGRQIRLIIGLAVTTVFAYLLLRHVKLDELAGAATQINRTTLLICSGFLVLEYGSRVVRWWLMLRACEPDIPLRACIWPLLVSVAINNVAPLRAGDAFRVISFRKRLRTPVMQILGTLIVERLFDVTILLLFLLAGLATLNDARTPSFYGHVAAFLACATLLCWVAFLTAGHWLHGLVLWTCRSRPLAARGWDRAAEQHVLQFITALAPIRQPRHAMQLLTISGAVWSFNGATFAAIAQGIGYDGSFFGPWFSLATATLSTFIPSSPGHVGTFDYFAMSGLMAYGASRAMATLFALLVHGVLWVPTTAAGAIYFLLPSSKLRRRASV